MKCRTCKGSFKPGRAGARFCSTRCRVAAHRAEQAPKRREARIERLKRELRSLELRRKEGDS